MTPPDPIALALILARILERLGVRYCIRGSVASSVYGEVRTTLDVDVVADLHSEDVDALVAALGSDFHVVEEAVRRAVQERSSFNLIHDEMLVKADVYVPVRPENTIRGPAIDLAGQSESRFPSHKSPGGPVQPPGGIVDDSRSITGRTSATTERHSWIKRMSGSARVAMMQPANLGEADDLAS